MNTCTVMMVSNKASPIILASVKSVLRQKDLAELVVVDTGNPPHLLARLQQMTLSEPKLKIIPGAGDISQSKALNMAEDKATGDVFLLLGMDCLLPPDALSELMTHMSSMSGVMIAGPNIVAPGGHNVFSHRKHTFTPETAVAEVFHVHAREDETLTAQDPEKEEAPVQVEYVSGLCLAIGREYFLKHDGLDEALSSAWDYDLCLRIRKAGGKILHIPSIDITHMQQEDKQTSFSKVQWSKATGRMHYFKKHFSDECVPGFLSLLHLVLMLRVMFRGIAHRLRRWFVPQSVMSHSVQAKRLMVLATGVVDLPQKKNWYGRTVLVTGATSQTGLCVVRHLISEGAAVLAITRARPIAYNHEHLRWIRGDLTDNDLDLQDYLIDAVVHCAPLWTLPASIGKLANAEVKRVIAFGSTSVFGKALSTNNYEKDIVHKLAQAEEDVAKLCDKNDIKWTVLRPTLTYGVGLDLGITSIAKCIDRFGVFFTYPPATGRRQPVHADDLARAVVLAMDEEKSYGKSYNISGGEVLTYQQMLERLFAVCKKNVRVIKTTVLPFLLSATGFFTRKKHLNGGIAHRMNDDLVFFHDDAKRDFGFKARPFLGGGLKDIEGF